MTFSPEEVEIYKLEVGKIIEVKIEEGTSHFVWLDKKKEKKK